MGLLYGENFVIVAKTFFDWSTRVTDRHTDRRADGQTDHWTDGRAAIAYMLSRVMKEFSTKRHNLSIVSGLVSGFVQNSSKKNLVINSW